MTRYLLAGVAALAIAAGPALAQDASQTATQSTTTTNIPGSSYSQSKSEKTYDSNGNVVEKKQTYQNGISGSSSSSSTDVKTPFGEESHYQKETTTRPAPAIPETTTTTRSTTTTTENQ